MGVSWLRNPLFPVLGFLTPVRGKRIRKIFPRSLLLVGLFSNCRYPVGSAMENLRQARGTQTWTHFGPQFADWNLSSTELESGNAIEAFLQTPAPVLDKISGPMGARFLSSTGLESGNLIGRAQFPPATALDKNRSPISGVIRANRKFEWFRRIGLTRYKNRGVNCEWLARIARATKFWSCWPWCRPGLSQEQTQVFKLFYTMEAKFVPGTKPACPWDNPGDEGRQKSLCVKSFCAFFRSLKLLATIQERERHINLRKSLGHQPVPGTPDGTDRRLQAGVPGISCCLLSRDTRPSRGSSKFLCVFSYVPFLSLTMCRREVDGWENISL